MAQPVIYDGGSPVYGTGALTVPWGTHATGFRALLYVHTNGALPTLDTPAGFTQVATVLQGTTTQIRGTLFSCEASSGSMASPVLAAQATGQRARMAITRYQAASPFHLIATSVVDTPAHAVSFAGGTTTNNNCLILTMAFGGIDSDAFVASSSWSATGTDDSGFFMWANDSQGAGGGFFGGQFEKAAAGSFGPLVSEWGAVDVTSQALMLVVLSDVEQGGAGLTGSFAKTLGALTVAGAGTAPIAGAFAKALGALTRSITGSSTVNGTLDKTPGAITLISAGVAANDIIGSLDIALDSLALASDASAEITGSLGVTLDSLVLASDASVLITGSLAGALDSLALASDASVLITGSLAGALDSLALASAGEAGLDEIAGSITVSLDSLALVSDASAPIAADAEIYLDDLSLASDAGSEVAGEMIGVLEIFTLVSRDYQGDAEPVNPLVGPLVFTLDRSITVTFTIADFNTGSTTFTLDD